MSFNTLIDWNSCSPEQRRALLTRPAISASDGITRTVSDILDNVKTRGDAMPLREYSAGDKTEVTALRVRHPEEIAAAGARLSDELKQAWPLPSVKRSIPRADATACRWKQRAYVVSTGYVPCASVGYCMYSPAARLRSSPAVLMHSDAGARHIAGCQNVVLCSPPPIADEILYAAQPAGGVQKSLTSAARRRLPLWPSAASPYRERGG